MVVKVKNILFWNRVFFFFFPFSFLFIQDKYYAMKYERERFWIEKLGKKISYFYEMKVFNLLSCINVPSFRNAIL